MKDDSSRYGNGHRRAVVRGACFELASVVVTSLTIDETDPTKGCPRREKGQASCDELTCDQCHLVSLNLASCSNDSAAGAIAHAFVKKIKQHDRHFNLSKNHGIVEPEDVDWAEMELTPTGLFLDKISVFLKNRYKIYKINFPF